MKIFFLYTFCMRHDRNISWEVQVNIFYLYKGIYNFEAVFLMDSRIPKEFVCASVFWNHMKLTLRSNLIKKTHQCTARGWQLKLIHSHMNNIFISSIYFFPRWLVLTYSIIHLALPFAIGPAIGKNLFPMYKSVWTLDLARRI